MSVKKVTLNPFALFIGNAGHHAACVFEIHAIKGGVINNYEPEASFGKGRLYIDGLRFTGHTVNHGNATIVSGSWAFENVHVSTTGIAKAMGKTLDVLASLWWQTRRDMGEVANVTDCAKRMVTLLRPEYVVARRSFVESCDPERVKSSMATFYGEQGQYMKVGPSFADTAHVYNDREVATRLLGNGRN